jgi:HEAT repeat protein
VPLLGDLDVDVRSEVVRALGCIGPAAAEAVPHLLPLLRDSKWSVRSRAEEALVGIGPEAVPHLAPLLSDPERSVRSGAEKALGRMGPEAVPHLAPLLGDTDGQVRRVVAEVLGRIGPAAAVAVPHLVPLLGDRLDDVRSEAEKALMQIGPRVDALSGLVETLRHENAVARRRARAVLRSWSSQLRGILFPDGAWQPWQEQALVLKKG